ncbi:MAG: MFS transporter [Synechococcus sp.]|nr:MFS transporter [Synechococcus sp.]
MGNASKTWLLGLDRQIWILAAGRLLSQIGTGFTAFYAPIFFVNQVGLSATQVGLALGSASVSGVLGRFLGGTGVDHPTWGRKKTLLTAAGVSAIADVALAPADNFGLLVLGNLLMGLGIGLYWPATETVVADLSTGNQRNEAFALVRLADNIGLGTGVMLGGLIIATIQNYRLLFVLDGISFVVFLGVIWVAIAETYQDHGEMEKQGNSWLMALRDQRLLIYMAVNIIFTMYIAQIQSTAPLYLTNFVKFSPQVISALFAWHIVFASLCQLAIARNLNLLSRPRALMVSLLLWGMGFTVMWATGMQALPVLLGAIISLGILALATDAYTPAASALVVDLAPVPQRGIYLALNSQCWAMGYLIGPPIGGWALDQVPAIAHGFWLAGALSIVPCLLILRYLESLMDIKKTEV